MKIVVDSDIPYINGVFEAAGCSVVYAAGRSIDAASVRDAHALIVRTRTRCDAALLDGSSVRMVATATIGTDHIDLDYCRSRGIAVFSAAGCNARAVAQWVFAAIGAMGATNGVLGVVGVGNVGGEVCAMGRRRGFDILMCDPPRAARGDAGFVELDHLLAHSDIVSLHVPLDLSTRDMADDRFFGEMGVDSLFLNSSRGEVVCDEALLGRGGRFALDVWRDEPHINLELLRRATIATPHVAGYSARGKARATQMCVSAVAKFLGLTTLENWDTGINFALEEPQDYDIAVDHRALASAPEHFEQLRRIRN